MPAPDGTVDQPPRSPPSPPPPMPMPLIGIVILNWNGWRDTMDAVASTRRLTYPRFRVYVVDNASTDNSETHLRAWAPDLILIPSGGNLGWSGGNNVGIRAAQRDGCAHVLLLNNDAAIRPDALTLLARAAAALPDAAALGALIVSADDPDHVEFGGAWIDARTGLPMQWHGRLSALRPPPAPERMAAVKGCAMLLTATGLAAAGALTEDYFLNYDETDWCYRATAAGLGNYLVADAVVEHKGAMSFQGTGGPLYRYFIARNRLLFARRHLDRRGRWHAWRSAFWDFRQALGHGGALSRLLLSLTILRAVADHALGRYGDCPPVIRAFNRRLAGRDKEVTSHFQTRR